MRRAQRKRQLTELLFDRHLVLLSFSDSIRKSPIASKYSIPLIPVWHWVDAKFHSRLTASASQVPVSASSVVVSLPCAVLIQAIPGGNRLAPPSPCTDRPLPQSPQVLGRLVNPISAQHDAHFFPYYISWKRRSYSSTK